MVILPRLLDHTVVLAKNLLIVNDVALPIFLVRAGILASTHRGASLHGLTSLGPQLILIGID